MNPDDLCEWQEFLGEVLLELVRCGGATAINPVTKQAMNADEVAAACRVGQSMQISILPIDAQKHLSIMRKHMRYYHWPRPTATPHEV